MTKGGVAFILPAMRLRPIDLLLLFALIAGSSYYAEHWLRLDGPLATAWKGSGVALLAAWALARGRRWIALVLAFGALGDVLLDAVSLEAGAVAFLIGHVVAAIFYVSHARSAERPHFRFGGPIAAAGPCLALFPEGWIGLLVYCTGLGLMAETAWQSRFRLAGIGAMLFVVSDLLIFAEMGLLAGSPLPALLIWPTYFAGQALIAWGVVTERAK